MARTAVSHLVIFMAAIVVSGMVVGAVTMAAMEYAQSVESEGDREATSLDADVEIINDPTGLGNYDHEDEIVTLYVKNIGGESFDPDALDVLFEGEYVEDHDATTLDSDRWSPGSVVAITFEYELDYGTYGAAVELHGNRDSIDLEYYRVVVETRSATAVENDSATLRGALVELGADTATVAFEWRQVGESTWNTTPERERGDEGEFDEALTDLVADTEYEFRAVGQIDQDEDVGETRTFRTDE